MGFDSSDNVLSRCFVMVADDGLLGSMRKCGGALCFRSTLTICDRVKTSQVRTSRSVCCMGCTLIGFACSACRLLVPLV
jgi:hypothetical protein